MCNCVEEIEEKVLARKAEDPRIKKPIERVRMRDQAIRLGTAGTGVDTFSIFELTLEGQKKKVPVTVIHSHCPFCGEKIDRSGKATAGRIK